MKRILFTIVLMCMLMVSCIPSLHPIFTEKTKIFDDRIIGQWYTNADDINIKDVSINKSFEGIELGKISIETTPGHVEPGFLEYWHFDRAANKRYVKMNEYGRLSNTLSDDKMMHRPDSSLLEKGWTLDTIEVLPYYILEYRGADSEDQELETMKINLTEINGHNYIDFSPFENSGFEHITRFTANYIPGHTFARYSIENGNMIIKSFDSDYIQNLIESKRVRLKHEIVDETIVLTASTEELRAFIAKYGDDEDLYIDDELLIRIQ